jgi:hypothetical protein
MIETIVHFAFYVVYYYSVEVLVRFAPTTFHIVDVDDFSSIILILIYQKI